MPKPTHTHVLFMFACILATACGTRTQQHDIKDMCSLGEPVKLDQELYCVFAQSVVIENGFSCPLEAAHLNVRAPIGVCSPHPERLTGEHFDKIDTLFEPIQPALYVNTCTLDRHCDANQICNARTCILQKTCTIDGECDPGSICTNSLCRHGSDEVCVPTTEVCDRTDNDCDHLTDENNVCANQNCTVDAQCTQGEVCDNGNCISNLPPTCQNNGDCTPNQVCVSMLCINR